MNAFMSVLAALFLGSTVEVANAHNHCWGSCQISAPVVISQDHYLEVASGTEDGKFMACEVANMRAGQYCDRMPGARVRPATCWYYGNGSQWVYSTQECSLQSGVFQFSCSRFFADDAKQALEQRCAKYGGQLNTDDITCSTIPNSSLPLDYCGQM